MSSQALNNIAHILLISGIIILIITGFLSVKFNLIGMLRTEFGRYKQTSVTGSSSVLSKTLGSSLTESRIEEIKEFEDEISENNTVVGEHRREPEISTELQSEYVDISNSETVIALSDKMVNDSDTTFIVSNKKRKDALSDDYCIIDDIIVIHGNPNIIK